MKILQLRFKNLNSLIGEWEIDFTSPQYVSEGIFAISGPTGAGKSTILDAICLALYGRTPRLDKISVSTNEIMSRKTGECFAEVVFESQKGKFRTIWSQTKSRKSATGNLQQPKFEISDFVTGNLISNQIRTTQLTVEECTGMDFNRFTQSMMLAQGGFAAFLKADANERAPILEQITGTEIYSTISKMVFERNKVEASKLQIIQAETNGIVIIADEELIILNEELVEKQKIELEQSNIKTSIDLSIKWLNDIDLLKKELMNIEQEEIMQQTELEAFCPEREVLQKAVKAFELEANYVTLTSERNLQEHDKNSLAKAEIELPALQITLNAANLEMMAAKETLENNELQALTERTFINKVREIDVNITHQKAIQKKTNEEIEEKNKQRVEKAGKIEDLTESILTKQKEQANAKTYLETNKRDERLITEFGAINASLNNLLQAKNAIGSIKTALNVLVKQQSNESEKLVADKKKFDLETTNLKSVTGQVKAIQNSVNELLKNRTLIDYKNELTLLNQKLSLLKEIENLEEKRQQLEDNKACPLCGSLHHPFAEGNTPSVNETDLKVKATTELIVQIEKANSALALADKDQQTYANLLTRAEAALQITQNDINKIEADIKAEKAKELLAVADAEALKVAVLALLMPLEITELTENGLRELNEILKSRLNLWNTNSEIKNSIDETIRTLEANILTENALLTEVIKSAEVIVISKTEIDNALNSILADRLEQFGDRNTDQEEKRLDEWLKTARTKQTQTERKWSELSNNFTTLTTQINQLNKTISERKMPLQALEIAFQQSLINADFSTETAFIDCRLDKISREKLQAKALGLDNKKLEILATKQERKTRLENEEVKKLTDVPVELLNEQSEEISKTIDTAKNRIVTIGEQLRNNAVGKKKISEIMLRIDLQKTDCLKWDGLSAIIGSADGKKYRNFAQGLTFEIMVSHANKQLTKLTDRYLLVRDKSEPLNLNVIDNYQAGECRSTKNLSGGESFYVSLALALGLSSMSSKNVRVDSLFLDEGFGTLDEETLEIALQTLSSLRQDGKLIGVISHVSSLKDRINTKIEVVKGVGGNSIIVGHGCRCLSL